MTKFVSSAHGYLSYRRGHRGRIAQVLTVVPVPSEIQPLYSGISPPATKEKHKLKIMGL